MIQLSLADTILIALYFAAVVYIGYRAGKRQRETADDFLLAGRTLTLPMFVATLVSTWYGGILAPTLIGVTSTPTLKMLSTNSSVNNPWSGRRSR